jgi:hypothetical protein
MDFVTFREEEELPDHTLTLRYRIRARAVSERALRNVTAEPQGGVEPSRCLHAAAGVSRLTTALKSHPSWRSCFERRASGRRRRSTFIKAARNAARIFANQESASSL